MALLGASFQIGRSALAAYESAVAITGQNIANLGNANYTRQTGRLSALEGGTSGGVSSGGGINLSGLERHVDEALEARLRMSLGARAGSGASAQALGDVETLYNELTDYDLSTQLTQFFNGFSDLQNDPTQMPARNQVLANADAMIRTLRYQRSSLLQQATDLNQTIAQSVEQANGIAGEIASLNEQIVLQEARGAGFSSPLKDRRDGLLRDLSELMDIQVRPQDNGTVNVYIGSEPLVEFSRSRGLKTETVLEDGLEQASIRFADNNGTVTLHDGQLAAQIAARDDHLVGQVQKLDELARGLIYEVNRAHANGRGLVGYSTITSAYAVKDNSSALNSAAAGLPFPVENGSFIVHVRNAQTGETTTRLIEVDLDGIDSPDVIGDEDTTLNSLAASLNGIPGLTANVTTDGRLHIEPASGSEVWFSEDSSGALAALGVGALLQGQDAATIDISAAVRSDPRLIAASSSGALADGENSGQLALLGQTASALLNHQTIEDYHAGMVNQVAIDTAAAQTAQEAADTVYTSLMAQRESVSGVSLDEETINLTKYERAYQGAARYLSVLDTMLTDVLALVS